jgi:hypothetical protein
MVVPPISSILPLVYVDCKWNTISDLLSRAVAMLVPKLGAMCPDQYLGPHDSMSFTFKIMEPSRRTSLQYIHRVELIHFVVCAMSLRARRCKPMHHSYAHQVFFRCLYFLTEFFWIIREYTPLVAICKSMARLITIIFSSECPSSVLGDFLDQQTSY